MKAISLWQPWASLWLSPVKVHETRDWVFPRWLIGQTIVVQAAKRTVQDEELDALLSTYVRYPLPSGALIGTLVVEYCGPCGQVVPVNEADEICGDWSTGRYAWRRGDYTVFKEPIPFVGRQGFFNVPDELIAKALA